MWDHLRYQHRTIEAGCVKNAWWRKRARRLNRMHCRHLKRHRRRTIVSTIQIYWKYWASARTQMPNTISMRTTNNVSTGNWTKVVWIRCRWVRKMAVPNETMILMWLCYAMVMLLCSAMTIRINRWAVWRQQNRNGTAYRWPIIMTAAVRVMVAFCHCDVHSDCNWHTNHFIISWNYRHRAAHRCTAAMEILWCKSWQLNPIRHPFYWRRNANATILSSNRSYVHIYYSTRTQLRQSFFFSQIVLFSFLFHLLLFRIYHFFCSTEMTRIMGN